MRAIAILLVFAVHTTPILLHGGRIGVDIFFVLSGFLITSILLQEYRLTRTINLKNFYIRRALRLFPALYSVLLAVIVYAAVVGTPQSMALTLTNALGAFLYVFNWQIVAAFPNYIEHQWMFSHIWSLSVEEQFYIVWPILILSLLFFRASLSIRLAIVMAGITLPAVARAILWWHEPSLSLYFRTDLRIDGLMWGALTAMIVEAGIVPSTRYRKLIEYAAMIALAMLLAIAAFEGLENGFLYIIGFALVGLATSVLIYGAVNALHPLLGLILENPALRWIGQISYGLYLWHWPIIRAVSPLNLSPFVATTLEFSATFAISALSFYYMERPILAFKERFISKSALG